ncbi:MAG: disulfide bond formation protein B [Minisyncoccia bacterium]
MPEALFTDIVSTLVLLSIPLIVILIIIRYTYVLPYTEWVRTQLNENALTFGFLTSLFATIGALTYSSVYDFAACDFCWYQRIAIYPMILLLGMAAIRKEKLIKPYVIVLAIAGILVSAYHWSIHMISVYGSQAAADGLVPCDATGILPSCSQTEVLEYGFITIPFMAISTLALVIVLMLFIKSKKSTFDTI